MQAVQLYHVIGVLRRPAAQHCPDTRMQLAWVAWLDDIVIGANV